MTKDDIISSVSIEFGLSKEQSEKTINNIFNAITTELKKNRNLEIKKFGKFKLITEKDTAQRSASIKFTPSQKLSQRVNGNFANLKKIKLKNDPVFLKERNVELKLPDEFKKTDGEVKKSEVEIVSEKGNEINSSGQRKLISEDLVKLHKEIINGATSEDENKGKTSETNLWG